jgi:hypothetical protein
MIQQINTITTGDNMAKSEMVEFEEEMRDEGFDEDTISQCRDVIREIYIGQNIRSDVGGILESYVKKFGHKLIRSLLKYDYIEKFQWNRYTHRLYCITEKGSKIGKSEVTNLIAENKKLIEYFLAKQPQKVLNFVVQEHLLKDGRYPNYIYPVAVNDINVFHWKDRLRKNVQIHDVWTSVLREFEALGLCIRTQSYVSTRGGELREENYVISPEVFTFLVGHCRKEALSLTDKDREKAELYEVLSQYTRDRLWEKLIDTKHKLEEAKVKTVVDKMAKEGITSEYKGFQSSEAPFSIKDKYRYEDWLEKNLWEEVVGSLLEQSKIEHLSALGRKADENKDEVVKVEKKEEVVEDTKIAPDPISKSIIIGSEREPEQWGIIGKSGSNNVLMDLNAPHIIFVCGKMGYGKGYIIGVLCEMLASHTIVHISKVLKKATIIVFHKPRDDVRSEFWSMINQNDVESEITSLKDYHASPSKLFDEKDFKVFLAPNVYENVKDKFERDYKTKNVFPLSMNPSMLSAEDWGIALSTGSSGTQYIRKLFKILDKLQFREFTVAELKKHISDSDLNKTQIDLATMRIELIEDFLKYGDFMKNLAIGGINVVDLRKLIKTPDDIFAIMTLILSVIQSKKDFEDEPFVFVINEAHDYFRKGISKEFVDKIEHLVRRKRYGANWLLLDTHKPDDVSNNVVEFSDVKIIHRMDTLTMAHSRDINKLIKKAEKSPDKLNVGEAIIVADESSKGKAVPILVRIRPRITEHGGATKTAV